MNQTLDPNSLMLLMFNENCKIYLLKRAVAKATLFRVCNLRRTEGCFFFYLTCNIMSYLVILFSISCNSQCKLTN